MEEFVKRHPILFVFVGPLMGAAFVMFLPFLGFVMLGVALWKKLYEKLQPMPQSEARKA